METLWADRDREYPGRWRERVKVRSGGAEAPSSLEGQRDAQEVGNDEESGRNRVYDLARQVAKREGGTVMTGK